MPTYAYLCTECEHQFEIVQSFKDDSLTTCPNCQGRLRKLFNAVGVVFKGSGFYSNDSRNGSRGSRSGSSDDSRNSRDSRDSRDSNNGSRSPEGSGHDSGVASVPAHSSEPGSSASRSSSSESADSAAGTGTTKTATKSVSKSEGSAA